MMDYGDLPDDAPGGDDPDHGPYADEFVKKLVRAAYARGFSDGVNANNARRDREEERRARRNIRRAAESIPVFVQVGVSCA